MKSIKQFVFKCNAEVLDDVADLWIRWPVQIILYSSETPDPDTVNLSVYDDILKDFPYSTHIKLGEIDLVSVVDTNVEFGG